MDERKPTGSGSDRCKLPRAFWDALRKHGLDAGAILREARLSATLLFDRSATLGTPELLAIWKAIESLSGDAGLAIRLVRDTETATHQLAFIAASYASDYRGGLAKVARYKRLCSPDELRFHEDGNRVTVSIRWPPGADLEPALSVDASFAMLIELGRRGTGQPIAARRLDLVRSDPQSTIHADYFGCPVRFGTERNLLVLNADDLNLPFPGHNPELSEMALSDQMHRLTIGAGQGMPAACLAPASRPPRSATSTRHPR